MCHHNIDPGVFFLKSYSTQLSMQFVMLIMVKCQQLLEFKICEHDKYNTLEFECRKRSAF